MPESRPLPARRSFLGTTIVGAMIAGLVASYGTIAAYAVRFLFPARDREKGWMLVRPLAEFAVGSAMGYETPSGARVTIARQDGGNEAESFVALSSTCPHLGCQVHWEGHNDRFFCPCHNGVFDRGGKAVTGPPADAQTDLPTYPLRVDGGVLYIEVPFADLKVADRLQPLSDERHAAAGHDPCLSRRAGVA